MAALQGFEHDKAGWSGSGQFTSPVDLITWHMTQGGSLEGARATLHQKRAESTILGEIRAKMGRRRVQLVDSDRAAKSLRNQSGGIETNKNGTHQVEIVGWSEHPEWFTEQDWLWCGEFIGGPLCRDKGIVPEAPLEFHPYPPENGIQLGREPWRVAPGDLKGNVGHQHWRENAHGDPGAWSRKLYRNGTASPIDLIIEGERKFLGLPTTKPGVITIMDITPEQLDDRIRNVVRSEIRAAVNPDGKGNLLVRIRNSVAQQDVRSVETVKGIRSLLRTASRILTAVTSPGDAHDVAAEAVERADKLEARALTPAVEVVTDPLDPPTV